MSIKRTKLRLETSIKLPYIGHSSASGLLGTLYKMAEDDD
jgi:hypothetical protein